MSDSPQYAMREKYPAISDAYRSLVARNTSKSETLALSRRLSLFPIEQLLGAKKLTGSSDARDCWRALASAEQTESKLFFSQLQRAKSIIVIGLNLYK